MALPDTVGKAWDDNIAKIRQGLSNDRQRLAFDEFSVNRRAQVMDSLSRHVAQETYRVDTETIEGLVENETNAAIADPSPTRAEQAALAVSQAYQAYGQQYGQPKEIIDSAVAKAKSRIFAGKIDRYLDNNEDIKARVYYEEHQDDILGTDRGKIEAAIQRGSTLGQAQRIADTIKPKYTEDMAQTDLEDEIPKLTQNPEVRQQAEQILGRWFQQKRADTRFREGQASAEAKAKLDAMETDLKNTMDRAGRNLAFEQVIPQSTRDLLSPQVEKGLREYWKLITEQKEPKTDPGTFYRLYTKATTEATKDDFAKENLMKYVGSLSRGDFSELVKLQGSIRKGDDKEADKQLDDFRTADQVINNTLATMGIDPKDKKNEATVARIHQLVGERADTLQRNTGKKATHQDLQSITDDVISTSYNGVNKGWIWDSTEPMRLVTMTVDQIPDADRKQTEEALRKAGRPVTDEGVLDLFIRTQERLKNRK